MQTYQLRYFDEGKERLLPVFVQGNKLYTVIKSNTTDLPVGSTFPIPQDFLVAANIKHQVQAKITKKDVYKGAIFKKGKDKIEVTYSDKDDTFYTLNQGKKQLTSTNDFLQFLEDNKYENVSFITGILRTVRTLLTPVLGFLTINLILKFVGDKLFKLGK